VLARKGRFLVAERFFAADAPGAGDRRGRASAQVVVAPAKGRGAPQARVGDLVLVRPSRPGRGAAGRAQVVRRIGRPDVARDVIEALMIDRGLRRGFPAGAEREARAAEGRRPGIPPPGGFGDGAGAESNRLDLRDLPTFTVDPATARDFDDAISARQCDGGRVRVWVHIADVSAYVREGSVLDAEALRRSTSVYVPGAVEPMLPEALSNDVCSLAPGEDRLAVTVEMDIAAGETGRVAFHRTLIRSDARLTYEEVDEIFTGTRRAREPWGDGLAAARIAAAGLAQARRSGGALDIGSAEPEFVFDTDGAVTVVDRSGRDMRASESRHMIEHLMIAANEAVARHLSDRGIPCLYRVHERPEPHRVEHLVAQLASLGVPTPPVPEPMSASQAADLMAEISVGLGRYLGEVQARAGEGATAPNAGGRIALTGLLLRTLQQARYSPRNTGHAGLGSQAYCHFTSPIRRYPDIVCHRGLLSTLGTGERAADTAGLAQLGVWTSEREREAMTIERDAADVARCFALEGYLQQHSWSAQFPGEITGLIGGGAFVAFGADASGGLVALYDGLLPVRRLRDTAPITGGGIGTHGRSTGRDSPARHAGDSGAGREWWELNELGTVLGSDSGRTLRLGDRVTVRIARIEAPRGRVELAPVPER
jgi:ribonuclease R